jgi:hypothetical protein
MAWANPHTIVQFDVKNEKGEPVHWSAELGSPSALSLIGWNKTSLSPGDVITVYIHQAKTKNPVGRIDHIVLADGSQLRDSGGGGDVGDTPRGRRAWWTWRRRAWRRRRHDKLLSGRTRHGGSMAYNVVTSGPDPRSVSGRR